MNHSDRFLKLLLRHASFLSTAKGGFHHFFSSQGSPSNVQKRLNRRRIGLLCGILLLILAVPCFSQTTDFAKTDPPKAKSAKAEPTDWPLFRHSAAGRAYVPQTVNSPLKEVWTFSDEGNQGFESSPIAAAGSIFIGSYDGYFYALDMQTGKVRWKYRTEAGFVASAGYAQGLVFCGDSDGIFYCWDAATGQLRWKFDSEMQIYSAPGFFRDMVLFNNQGGKFFALDIASGAKKGLYEAKDQLRCSVVVVQNRAFLCGCDGRLHIVDLDSFQAASFVDLSAPTGSTAAVSGVRLFLGTEGNEVLAIQWKTGQVLWRFHAAANPAPFRSSAAIGPQNLVFIGSNDKRLYALEEQTGAMRWIFAAKRSIEGSPIILDDIVAFGSTDGRLYFLDAATGKELDKIDLGDAILSSPCFAGGKLFVSTTAGVLYCFQ